MKSTFIKYFLSIFIFLLGGNFLIGNTKSISLEINKELLNTPHLVVKSSSPDSKGHNKKIDIIVENEKNEEDEDNIEDEEYLSTQFDSFVDLLLNRLQQNHNQKEFKVQTPFQYFKYHFISRYIILGVFRI